MTRHLPLLIILIACFAASAPSQTAFPPTNRDWEIALFGGRSSLGEKQYATPVLGQGQEAPRAVRVRYAGGAQLGFRIAENRWDHWGAQFEYSLSNQPLSIGNLSPDTPSIGLSHRIHRCMYDVLYYPFERSSRFRPFAFAGAGVSLFHIGDSSRTDAGAQGIKLQDSWKLTFGWGGGLKYLIQDQIAVSFQIGDHVTDQPAYGLPSSARVTGNQFIPGLQPDGYRHNWLLSLGFVYQWGER